MYIDELISELEKWKSKTAEVTVNGIPIDRVTCGNGDNIIILAEGWKPRKEEVEIEELEEEIEDLKDKLSRIEDIIDEDW